MARTPSDFNSRAPSRSRSGSDDAKRGGPKRAGSSMREADGERPSRFGAKPSGGAKFAPRGGAGFKPRAEGETAERPARSFGARVASGADRGEERGSGFGKPAGKFAGKSFGTASGKPGAKPFGRSEGKPGGKPFGKPTRGPAKSAGRDEHVAPIKLPVKDADAPERIAKAMSRGGVASRRDAEKMILEGRVFVNGKVIDSPALTVTAKDKITIDGHTLAAPEPPRLWLYHKPEGLVTSARDELGRPTVFEDLPEDMPRVMSVGRLDLTSEGLLLLTNDGELKRRLELPSTGWLRKYRVRVNGRPMDPDFEPLREGITIDGENFAPMIVALDRQQGANAWLTVAIREGRNREIRRGMEAVGYQVNRLIRVSYGPFQLGDLKPGEVAEVRPRLLRDQLGLSDAVAPTEGPREGFRETERGQRGTSRTVQRPSGTEVSPYAPRSGASERGERPTYARKPAERTSEGERSKFVARSGDRPSYGKPREGERSFTPRDGKSERPSFGKPRSSEGGFTPRSGGSDRPAFGASKPVARTGFASRSTADERPSFGRGAASERGAQSEGRGSFGKPAQTRDSAPRGEFGRGEFGRGEASRGKPLREGNSPRQEQSRGKPGLSRGSARGEAEAKPSWSKDDAPKGRRPMGGKPQSSGSRAPGGKGFGGKPSGGPSRKR